MATGTDEGLGSEAAGAGTLPAAEIGPRLVAVIVDVIIIGILFQIPGIAITLAPLPGRDSAEALVLGIGLSLALTALPCATFLWATARSGATPGQRVAGLRVVAADGGPPSAWAQVLRIILVFAPQAIGSAMVVTVALFEGFGVAVFAILGPPTYYLAALALTLLNRDRLAPHDLLTRTRVVKADARVMAGRTPPG